MWFMQRSSPAPGGLGGTVEHGLEAAQPQASLGWEAPQVPKGMPSWESSLFSSREGDIHYTAPTVTADESREKNVALTQLQALLLG